MQCPDFPAGIQHFYEVIRPITARTENGIDAHSVHARMVAGVLARLATVLTFYEIVQELHVVLIADAKPASEAVYECVDRVVFDPTSKTAPFTRLQKRAHPYTERMGRRLPSGSMVRRRS